MSDVEDLKTVLKETLESRGVIGQLKARIRAELQSALEDKSQQRPKLSNENFLINELIKEYLEFNQYHYASSVLTAEAGQPKESMSREFLAQEFNVTSDAAESQNIPILYKIVAKSKRNEKDYATTK